MAICTFFFLLLNTNLYDQLLSADTEKILTKERVSLARRVSETNSAVEAATLEKSERSFRSTLTKAAEF